MIQNQLSNDPWDKEGQQLPTNFDRRFEGVHGRRWNALELALLRFDELPEHSRCLEVGCGTGRFILDLSDRGHEAHGLDPSADMVEIARNKTQGRDNVYLRRGEGESLPFDDNSFDFVFAVRVTRHTPSREYCLRMVDEMIRVTRPGGRIEIEFSNKLRPRRKAAETTFSLGELEATFSSRGDTGIIREDGLMFLSQVLFYKVPPALLPVWSGIDNFLSNLMPKLASYFYLTLRKK